MDHYPLYLSYHSNIYGPICSRLSGWATTTGRLLDLKMAFRIVLNDTRGTTAWGVELRFSNLSITNPALSQLSCHLLLPV